MDSRSIRILCLVTALTVGMLLQQASAQNAPAPAEAQDQSYPTKPITIIASAAPGGVVDLLARTVGQRLTKSWGQQVVIENKAGASNQIAAEYVANSAPDGYTLLVTPEATMVVNPSLYSKLPYDPNKDLVPITGLVSIHHALIANSSLPVQSAKDLVQLGKQTPGGLNYGTYGVGSTGHLNMELFQNMAGVKFVPVHYKGATPALTDVIAGHIQIMFISVSSAVQPWRAGQLKLLAVGSRHRLAQIPDVATVAENGLPEFEAMSWFGLFAPRGTPNAVVSKVNKEIQKVFRDPEFKEKFLRANMFESMVSSPEQFSAFIRSDAQKWDKIIRHAKVRLE